MSNALVTGATGLVGFNIVQALRRRGQSVRCLARNPEAARAVLGDEVEIVPGDLLEASSLRRAIQGC
ncbi:MAG: NAD-dependent epimerase/dehydratase family protein, partial [Acidobacteriota bacterium]